jgi:hypothetical protein
MCVYFFKRWYSVASIGFGIDKENIMPAGMYILSPVRICWDRYANKSKFYKICFFQLHLHNYRSVSKLSIINTSVYMLENKTLLCLE